MKLTKSLIVLDLETTGTWIEKDRIIEIALIKLNPDSSREEFSTRVNPCMPIPPIVSEITGIKDEDVKAVPAFGAIAGKVLSFLGDCDLGGFNVERFDLPLLAREFTDAGLTFDYSNRTIIDAQKVFHFHQKRDLTAAYQFYCKQELQNAHSALADTQATVDILEAQIELYGNGSQDIAVLKPFDYKPTADYFDAERKFRWWNGELYMTFGKYAKRESLRIIAQKDPGYLDWILDKDFGDDVKGMIQGILNGRFPEPPKYVGADI